MAGTAEGLIVRRTDLLVRCQEAREARRLVAAAQARRLCVDTGLAHRQARDALAAHQTARAAELRRTYDDISGRAVDAAMLQALPDIERKLSERARVLTDLAATALKALRAAEAAEREAQAALSSAARKTQRRRRLAQVASDQNQLMLAAAEEMAREDQVAELWRPA